VKGAALHGDVRAGIALLIVIGLEFGRVGFQNGSDCRAAGPAFGHLSQNVDVRRGNTRNRQVAHGEARARGDIEGDIDDRPVLEADNRSVHYAVR